MSIKTKCIISERKILPPPPCDVIINNAYKHALWKRQVEIRISDHNNSVKITSLYSQDIKSTLAYLKLQNYQHNNLASVQIPQGISLHWLTGNEFSEFDIILSEMFFSCKLSVGCFCKLCIHYDSSIYQCISHPKIVWTFL